MHPSLKGYSSARAMSERASSRAEARSVSRVSSSIALGIDKGRALVKNPAVPVDIIAKVAVIIPIQFACLFFLHLTYYKLPPNSFIFFYFLPSIILPVYKISSSLIISGIPSSSC